MFIDDILVYSKNKSYHICNLGFVLQTHNEYQLFAKYRKCWYWLRLVTFLWHIISSEGDDVDPRKMEAVKNFPKPLTPKDIRRFLGLVGYYWSFVDGFPHIASSLTTFTQKK